MSENWSSSLVSQSYFGIFNAIANVHAACLNVSKINKNIKNLMTSTVYANYCEKEIAAASYLLVAKQVPKVRLWRGTRTTFLSWKSQFLSRILVHISLLRF